MAEKRNGAGSRVAGLLERAPPGSPPVDLEATEDDPGPVGPGADIEPTPARGRGATPRKAKPPDARTAKRIVGRTIYIPGRPVRANHRPGPPAEPDDQRIRRHSP